MLHLVLVAIFAIQIFKVCNRPSANVALPIQTLEGHFIATKFRSSTMFRLNLFYVFIDTFHSPHCFLSETMKRKLLSIFQNSLVCKAIIIPEYSAMSTKLDLKSFLEFWGDFPQIQVKKCPKKGCKIYGLS